MAQKNEICYNLDWSYKKGATFKTCSYGVGDIYEHFARIVLDHWHYCRIDYDY